MPSSSAPWTTSANTSTRAPPFDVMISDRAGESSQPRPPASRHRAASRRSPETARLAQAQPRVFSSRRKLGKQRIGTTLPALRDRRLPAKLQRIHCNGYRDSTCAATIAAFLVQLVGPLTSVEERLGIVEPPSRHAEPLERLRSFGEGACPFESTARASPVTSSELGVTARE